MCAPLRCTASLGRSSVPRIFLRIRSCSRCRISSFVLTLISSLRRAFPGRSRSPASPPLLSNTGGAAPPPPYPPARSRQRLLGTCCSRLARLLLELLAHVADPLLLVGIRPAQPADLGRHLAD